MDNGAVMTDTESLNLTANAEATVVDPQAVADLMLALERVFKIGVYYPAGHVLCDQVADHFLGALTRVVGKARVLRFEYLRGILSVQGLELEVGLRGVRNFQDLLNELGVSGVEIDGDVNAADLHTFVSKLLAYRNQVKGARNFQQIIVEGMPPTIRVQHLEFLARESTDSESDEEVDPSRPTIDILLSALAKHGLSKEQLALCRKLLEAIPSLLKERHQAGVALPFVTWSDVEKLLLQAVEQDSGASRSEGARRPGTHLNLDALAAIFTTLGQEADAENPRHAIDLLVSLSQRKPVTSASKPTAVKEAPRASSGDRPEMPLEELQAAMEANARLADGPPVLDGDDRCEELSILMQMLTRDQKLPVQVRIQNLIRDVLSSPLEAAERRIAVEGVRQLMDGEESERLAGAVVMMTDALRRSEHNSTLAFLRDVCEGRSQEQLAAIWPFLVNEILLTGEQREPEEFQKLCDLAARLPEEHMQRGLSQLEHLEALRDKHFAADIFAPPPLPLCPIAALLLNSTQAPMIGERLLRGLQRKPLNWLSEAVVPLLGGYQQRHRRFLSELLRQADQQQFTSALTVSAGRIIAESLPGLSRKERREPWVPAAIRAVSKLPVSNAEATLREIAYKRRFLVLYPWPLACRTAARETLAVLRKRAE
jgi:hypothetical protein